MVSDCLFYNRFKEIKNHLNHLIRKSKINDFNIKINDKLKDSRAFHSELKKYNVVSSKKTGDGKCHFDPHKLNQSFVSNNNSFVNKRRLEDSVAKINRSSVNTCFKFNEVGEQDILNVVKTMKSNACGVDEVSAFLSN